MNNTFFIFSNPFPSISMSQESFNELNRMYLIKFQNHFKIICSTTCRLVAFIPFHKWPSIRTVKHSSDDSKSLWPPIRSVQHSSDVSKLSIGIQLRVYYFKILKSTKMHPFLGKLHIQHPKYRQSFLTPSLHPMLMLIWTCLYQSCKMLSRLHIWTSNWIWNKLLPTHWMPNTIQSEILKSQVFLIFFYF